MASKDLNGPNSSLAQIFQIDIVFNFLLPVVGSSRNSNFGFVISSVAKDNRFLCPPDNFDIGTFLQSNRPSSINNLMDKNVLSVLLASIFNAH